MSNLRAALRELFLVDTHFCGWRPPDMRQVCRDAGRAVVEEAHVEHVLVVLNFQLTKKNFSEYSEQIRMCLTLDKCSSADGCFRPGTNHEQRALHLLDVERLQAQEAQYVRSARTTDASWAPNSFFASNASCSASGMEPSGLNFGVWASCQRFGDILGSLAVTSPCPCSGWPVRLRGHLLLHHRLGHLARAAAARHHDHPRRRARVPHRVGVQRLL